MKITFYEAFEEEKDLLQKNLNHNLEAQFYPLTIQESNHETMPPSNIISIRTQSKVPRTWLNSLDAILTRSTGYDHIHSLLKTSPHNIPCGYLPKYCSKAVAEQAMLLWMALLRKLNRQTQNFLTFDRNNLTGAECTNKNLLIVGVGNIGSEVAKIGTALGMKVQGVDLEKKFNWIEYTTIEKGLPSADIIICAMNLTKYNNHYFNYNRLTTAKNTAIFINISRGEFSPCEDMLKLLNDNKIAGIGLDVYENEQTLSQDLRDTKLQSNKNNVILRLASHDNAILTPHNAFNTNEATQRKALQSIEQLEYFIKYGTFKWQVPNNEG